MQDIENWLVWFVGLGAGVFWFKISLSQLIFFFMRYIGMGVFYFKIPRSALAFSVSRYPLLQLSLLSI